MKNIVMGIQYLQLLRRTPPKGMAWKVMVGTLQVMVATTAWYAAVAVAAVKWPAVAAVAAQLPIDNRWYL